ncbi:MAG: carboxypeptidase regulatory-like domain-containing protein [Bacteroidaceae bacterium]|nr:carboxypeptidase regulatory-like domain-containing protein [Bacteroidaceae bacterium]
MKKKNFLHLLAALLVGVLCVSVTTSCGSDDDSPATPTTGRIVGIVSDYAHANVPVAGATVTLVQQGTVKVTGSDGRFEFDNLPVGSYTVAVVANNFQSNTQMAYVSAGNVTTCDFSLQRGALDVKFSTLSLTFGKNIDQLVFYITNNTNQLLTYSFSDVPDYVKISPLTGSLSPKSKQAVLVSVPDRSKVTTSGTQIVRVNVGTDSYAIMLTTTNDNVKPEDAGGEVPGGGGGGGEDPVPGDKTDVTRGLLAFYNFDDGTVNNAAGSQNNGVLMGDGQFITDTPNGEGKALFLDQEQYVNVARNPLNGKRAYTISLWAKDFGTGYLFTTFHDGSGYNSVDACCIYIQNSGKISCVPGFEEKQFNYNATTLQTSGWHMITIVGSENLAELYIDGSLTDNQSFGFDIQGSKMQIGGCHDDDWLTPWADPFKVDNVRVYGVSLTEEEVGQLYKFEKK